MYRDIRAILPHMDVTWSRGLRDANFERLDVGRFAPMGDRQQHASRMKRLCFHSTAAKASAALMFLAGMLAATSYGSEPGKPNIAAEAAGQHYIVPTSIPKNQQAEILLRAARNSVAMGNIAEALARFETLLDLTPRDDHARFEYAGLLMQAGRLANARAQLERIVKEQQHVSKYRLALADLLLRLKDYSSARDQLRLLLSDKGFGPRAALKIARSFAGEHHFAEADAVLDSHSSQLKDLDSSSQLELGRLLIDLERPAQAVALLSALHDASRDDESISATLLLAKVRMNARAEAIESIAQLEKQPLKDAGVWQQLASQFYEEQAFPEALALYQQVLRRFPERHAAALGMARTYLRLYEPDSARKILLEPRGDLNERDRSMVMAEYHALVGEYSEAIAIARRLFEADAGDVQAAILLGNVYHDSSQFQLAAAAYSAALAHCSPHDQEQHREILRLLAKNDLFGRQLDRAIAILRSLVEEHPSDVASRLLLMETLAEAKRFGEAEAVAKSAIETYNPRDRVALDTQLGYVLLKQGKWADAAEQFRSLALESNERSPDVAYGLSQAATKANQPALAREAMSLGPSLLAPPAMWGVVIAGRALGYCECESAAAVLDNALVTSPGNLVLLNLRGEAAQQCNCGCQSPDCRCRADKVRDAMSGSRSGASPPANRWFQAVIHTSPTNVRAHLGCARSYQEYLAYESANAEYRELLRLMPQDVTIVREAARLVEDWRGLECAAPIYAEGQASLLPAAGSEAPGGDAPTPSSSEPIASAADSQLLSSEYGARYLRGWRLHQAIPAYQCLIDMEPSNEAAIFDLAQCQSALNRTQCAVDTYERLLAADPCNQNAATALLRNQLEMQPKILGGFDYEDQRGRQGLANMTWYNFSMSGRRPLGDENEFFEVGYRERILQPTDDRQDFGEIPYVRWQQKYDVDSLAYLELAVEKYQYGLKTRPTFNVGIDVLRQDDTEIRISGFLKNYYVCGEAVRQDIYTTGIQIDGVYRPQRLWTLSGYYRIANFSDNNWVNWVNLNSAHLLWQGRRQLRGIIDYNFYTFAHQTIFGPIPGSLVGTIHPYWSPSGYSVLSTGLELTQWFSCDRFKGANEHFAMVFAGAAVDSNGQPYFLAISRWQRDLSEKMTWTIDANLTRSQEQVYNAVGVATYGVLRLW
jgi:tetratricopeptide (TPR) repeat protein